MSIRTLLTEPALAEVDVDSPERITQHRSILLRKRMIREVFFELYDLLADAERRHFYPAQGRRIEIGAGSSLLKIKMSDVEITDIVPYAGLERVVDAQNMPFEDESLKTIFAIHSFHHLPDPYRFLAEVERVCRPGGGAIMIDPYYGPIASLVYKRLFTSENFDKGGPAVVPAGGPISGANQALSYVVFVRERDRLAQQFPNLELLEMEPISNYIRYTVSGGLNFRQLLPDASIPLLKGIEALLSPLRRMLALHQLIVVRKKC